MHMIIHIRSVQDVQRVIRESSVAQINLDPKFIFGKLAWAHATSFPIGSCNMDSAFDVIADLPPDTKPGVKSHIYWQISK